MDSWRSAKRFGSILLVGLLFSACSSGSPNSSSDQTLTTESTTTTEIVMTATSSSTTTTTVAQLPLAGKVVAIDAGHNGGNEAHSAEITQLVDAGAGVAEACDTSGWGPCITQRARAGDHKRHHASRRSWPTESLHRSQGVH